MIKELRYFAAGTLLLATACSNTPVLKEDEINERFKPVQTLKVSLAKSDQQDIDILVPGRYSLAKQKYNKARAYALKDNAEANTEAESGLAEIQKAKAALEKAQYELKVVMDARQSALQSGAQQQAPEKFEEADAVLKRLAAKLEAGDVAAAREGRAAAAKAFSDLEIASLKKVTIAETTQLLEQAKKQGIDDLAPKTIALAEKELALANKVIEADKTATEKAGIHAKASTYHIRRAEQISALIKEFKDSKMSSEDMVIWYQDQLGESVKPFFSSLDYSQRNTALVNNIARDLSNKKATINNLQSELAQQNKKYTSEISKLQLQSNKERAKNEALKARFEKISNMFTKEEAEVYKQGNNVLIRTYGFVFPSGSSEITSGNYPLLNKIVKGIKLFPGSKVEVSGHTDNRGSDKLNNRLSQERSEKVASFLVNLGNMDQSQVSSSGYGKSKPIASNDSAEGRAANRRVEILIVN